MARYKVTRTSVSVGYVQHEVLTRKAALAELVAIATLDLRNGVQDAEYQIYQQS